jgi:hypothetical protein
MKKSTQIMTVCIALMATGCATTDLPHGAHVVGGGLKIDWSPPASESGTAILVDKTSGTMVMTKQLGNGLAGFNFDVTDPDDMEVLRDVFAGSAPTNAQYLLYFVPRPE